MITHIYTDFINNKFFAYNIASGDNVYSISDDGLNWKKYMLPLTYTITTMTYGLNKFFFFGYNSISNDETFITRNYIYSEDGINLVKGTLPKTIEGQSIASSNNMVVVTGANNVILYSNDGINWEEIITTKYKNITHPQIIYCKDRFIIYEIGSKYYYYSKDCKDWVLNEFPTQIDTLAYANNYFVACDITNKISYFSIDGLKWTSKLIPSSLSNIDFYKIIGINDEFVLMLEKMDYSTYNIEYNFFNMLLE